MSRETMKSRLSDLRLYKILVPSVTDIGVILVSYEGGDSGFRIPLRRCRGGGRHSRAGLSRSFVHLLRWFFIFERKYSNITSQILTYMTSNFCFKDLRIVPPACPVLVFHVDTREYGEDRSREVDIARVVLDILGTRNSLLTVEDARTRLVPIAPPTTEIVDCYQSSELCCLCEKGYPKEDEIVYKTKCNHIFHATCISGYLLHTPRCPVCSVELPPVDVRTLLFV